MSLPTRLHDQTVAIGRATRFASLVVAVCAAVSLGAQAPPDPVVPSTVRVGVSRAGGAVTVEALPLEEYVARVVSGEGQPRAGAAAQQALAIVIRTFAAANRHRHRAEGYDLCDTTHCQVLRPVHPAAREAALATAGQVLLDEGRPAFVFYSAHNGGSPALASEVWPGATDYPSDVTHDDACADDAGWSSEVPRTDLEKALRAMGASGARLKALTVVERTASDRAARLRADGFTPAMLSAYEFRMAVGRTLGWQIVRSTAFEIAPTARGFKFTGVGYGHGVGLCVVGAGKRAARGESASEILRTYFRDLAIGPTPTRSTAAGRPAVPAGAGAPSPAPAVSVAPATSGALMPAPSPAPASVPAEAPAPTDVRLELPPDLEPERAGLLSLARETRDQVAARALVTAPSTLTITAHPTMEAFGLATGQPWWVSAATVGTSIDLAPLSQLRARGLLESALRYEVATAVVTPYLNKAPVWVRVGAALFFTTPLSATPSASGRVRCPSDAELLRPVSGGAQREAFLRAERCVRREIARGRALTTLR
jgi:SpoIID/LytB domain protein